MNKQVDEYIGKQKSPQKEVCMQLRGIILGTFPNIEEEMKWVFRLMQKGNSTLLR